jgi:hypothetical protein
MQKSKALFRTGLISILVFSIILCSFTTGMVRHNTSQGTPFQTLPPVNATLSTPIGAQTPVPTPLPTLGPGQYFEEGEEDSLPEVARPELLSEPFGYSEILGQTGQVLVWSTDDEGHKHYYVLEKTSDYFQRIQNIVDLNREAGRALEASNPLLRGIWADIKAGGGLLGGLFCGIAAIVMIEVPPLAAGLTACSVASFTFMGYSIDETISVIGELTDYDSRTEEDRLAIEGIFREIRSSPQS